MHGIVGTIDTAKQKGDMIKKNVTSSKNISKQLKPHPHKKVNTALLIAFHRLLSHPVAQRWFLNHATAYLAENK